LCNSAGEIGPYEFETIMRRKMHTFVQTRLTDFSDCRTAEDMELTSIGALKTIVSEVLLMAREQQKAHSHIIKVLSQLQNNKPSGLNDSRTEQIAVSQLQSSPSGPCGSASALRPPTAEICQSSLSGLELSSYPMTDIPLPKTISPQLNLDPYSVSESISWTNLKAGDISFPPREEQVIVPQDGDWRQQHVQEENNIGDTSKIFKLDQEKRLVISEEINGETEQAAVVLDFCTRADDTSDYLTPPALVSTVMSASTVTPQSQLQILPSNGVDVLSSTSISSGQYLQKGNVETIFSPTCSEILIPDARPSLDHVDSKVLHGRESANSEGPITIPGDSVKDPNCYSPQALAMSQNAIDITPSLNLGQHHYSLQWDPAQEYQQLT
jgi:hypothetical protein